MVFKIASRMVFRGARIKKINRIVKRRRTRHQNYKPTKKGGLKTRRKIFKTV